MATNRKYIPRRAFIWGSRIAVYLAALFLIPQWWCGRTATRWYHDDPQLRGPLANTVNVWVKQELSRKVFHTSNQQFDGEWLFGTYMMAGMGFGQLALSRPKADRAADIERMELCIERLLSAEVRAFDRELWHEDALESLNGDKHHAAYLGYLNLVLSFHRFLKPDSKYASLNDQITAALMRRLEHSPTLLLQSYPRETYPVDNSAVIGSIGMHARATGTDHSALLQKWVGNCRQRYVDRVSGLLYQCVDSESGQPVDEPRASGTALGLYLLRYADVDFSRELFNALRREMSGGILGFGLMREYPRSVKGGDGDIDSGPVIFGYGVSATGFSLAGARMFSDEHLFRKLFSTAYLYGSPVQKGDRFEFVMGGHIGNAIIFAMLTAPRELEEKP